MHAFARIVVLAVVLVLLHLAWPAPARGFAPSSYCFGNSGPVCMTLRLCQQFERCGPGATDYCCSRETTEFYYRFYQPR